MERHESPAHAFKKYLVAEVEEKLTMWVENNSEARISYYGGDK